LKTQNVRKQKKRLKEGEGIATFPTIQIPKDQHRNTKKGSKGKGGRRGFKLVGGGKV